MKKVSPKTSPSYNFAVDVIRVVAIFGVVAIHTFNSVFERPDFFGGKSWWISITINSISRITIPLFIMISGYLLLIKNENFATTLKRIFNRLLIPLVFWTVLNFIVSNVKNYSEIFTPRFYIRFLTGDVYYYYFIVILTGLYFVSPLIRNYLKTATIQAQRYMGFLFLTVGALETFEEYVVKSCAADNSFTKWVPYTGLFVIGYLIGTGKLKFKNKTSVFVGYAVGLLSTITLNYIYYSSGSVNVIRTNPVGCITHYSDNYLSFNVIIMSIAAFAILFNQNYELIKNKFVEKLIYTIARASFGIYLIHLFIVTIWDKWLMWNVDSTHLPLWLYAITKWLGVFLISFILVSIIIKIPGIRRLIGENKTNKKTS